MAGLQLLLSAILSPLFVLYVASADTAQSTSSSQFSSKSTSLSNELLDLKLKVAQLESILEESIQTLNTENLYVDERDKLINEASQKIQSLQSSLSDIKDDSSSADQRISILEEEVRHLWAALRKNNFDLHVLESKAKDSEDALDVLALKVEKLADIVSEQWIQIQRLEQALQITKMRTLDARKRSWVSSECTFLKFANGVYDRQLKKVFGMLNGYLSGKEAKSSSYASRALDHLKIGFSTLKKYHHELQDLIRKEMERSKVTAALANRELVFFMASAVVVFPIMSAWLWLSSTLN